MRTRQLLLGRMGPGVAGVAAIALLVTACSSSGGSTSSKSSSSSGTSSSSSGTSSSPGAASAGPSQFTVGSFLPLTGSLSFLAPPAVAGVGAAIRDINAAGGVNGKPAKLISQDSSDGDHKAIGNANIAKLLQANVSAVVGPESSTVTENILTQTNAANTVVFSPAATDDALTKGQYKSKWFFRDVAPNAAEGNALGNQILSDIPAAKVAVLVFNDAYGLNLRDTLVSTIDAGGGKVTYGTKGQEFASTETSFGTVVNNALATKPDAIAIIAFDQTAAILQALGQAKWTMKNTYFVDGNLADYSDAKQYPGVPDLTGAKGTQQGVDPNPAFKKELDTWYQTNQHKSLGGIYNYAAESYDAVTILALAAELAGKNDSASIQAVIPAVTGTSGGPIVKTYAAAVKAIKGGAKAIHYEGPSSIGPLNANHDPSTAYVGIYQAVGKNTAKKFLTAIKATIK